MIQNQKGVSTLELAIALPLFITIIFGTLQISNRISSLQAVSAAANEGVKTASSFSIDSGICPTEQSSFTSRCHSGVKQLLPSDPSLEVVANISTCNYLHDNGLDANNWEVETKVYNQFSAGKSFPVIELTLTEVKTDCTFCNNFVSNLIPNNSQAVISVNGCLI